MLKVMVMNNKVMLIALCSSFLTFSQKGGSDLRSGQMQNYNPVLSRSVNSFLESGEIIEGSRFVFDVFHDNGKVYLGNQTYKADGLNIDALKKELVLKMNMDSILILDKTKIDSIVIDGHHFRKIGHNDLFYEVLYESSGAVLLKMYDCQIKQGKANVMKGTSGNDSYHLTEAYFVQLNKGAMQPFRMNRKHVLDFFGGEQSSIKAFIRDNKLKINKEEDVVKLFYHYYFTLNTTL